MFVSIWVCCFHSQFLFNWPGFSPESFQLTLGFPERTFGNHGADAFSVCKVFVASTLSSSGVPSHDLPQLLYSACTMTVVIFGHLNRSLYLLTCILTAWCEAAVNMFVDKLLWFGVLSGLSWWCLWVYCRYALRYHRSRCTARTAFVIYQTCSCSVNTTLAVFTPVAVCKDITYIWARPDINPHAKHRGTDVTWVQANVSKWQCKQWVGSESTNPINIDLDRFVRRDQSSPMNEKERVRQVRRLFYYRGVHYYVIPS